MNEDEFLNKLYAMRLQFLEVSHRDAYTAADCETNAKECNRIAEEIARFVINPQEDADMVFQRLVLK